MSTRGRIAIELKDGSVLSIYSHWNNSPEHNGCILRTHYNTREKVEALVDLGDISALWTNVGWNNETLPETGPLPYSSRGEDCPPRLDADLCEYLLPDGCEEYHYIFTQNNQWVCYDMHQFDNTKLPEVVEIPVPAVV
jgi:hypothetical protein